MKRKVVCVFGKFDEKDFVLVSTCSKNCVCITCKDGFWIEKVKEKKE